MSDRSHYVDRDLVVTGMLSIRNLDAGGRRVKNTSATGVRYKQWADRGLYAVVSAHLDDLEASDRFLVLQLLDHIHAVDRIFQHHLTGRAHGYDSARSREPMPFAVLAERAREVDAWYVDYVDSQPEEALGEDVEFVFTSGRPARMSRRDMVAHVVLHGTYHRGNAGILLQKNGIVPSDDRLTDFLGAGASH
jgi:uncharacterized damage-inducible protein DinB